MGQGELPLSVAKGRKGRHETAMDRTVVAARRDGLLIDMDGALATVLRALGRTLDSAERHDQPYATAAASREVLAVLEAARMTPAQRPPDVADPFADLVTALRGDD